MTRFRYLSLFFHGYVKAKAKCTAFKNEMLLGFDRGHNAERAAFVSTRRATENGKSLRCIGGSAISPCAGP